MQKRSATLVLGIAALAASVQGAPADMGMIMLPDATAVQWTPGTGPFDLHYINPADDPRNDQNDPRNEK